MNPRPPLFTSKFIALLLTQLCFGYAFSSFFLLPKYLATEYHANAQDIGNVMGAFGLSSVFLVPLVGHWIDRGKRRQYLIWGCVVFVFASAGFYFVDGIGWPIIFLRILQGVAFSLTFVTANTLIVDHAAPERLGQAVGVFGAAMLSMNAIGPAITEPFAAAYGWKPVFMFSSIVAMGAVALSLRVSERPTLPAPGTHIPEFAEVLRQTGILRISSVGFIGGVAFGCMMTFQQPFALELGIESISRFFLAYAAAALFVRLFLGSWVDGERRFLVMTVSALVYSFAVFWMSQLARWNFEIIGLVFGLAHGLLFPILITIALEQVGEHARGKMTGLFHGSFNFGMSAGVAVLGIVARRHGYPIIFVISGALVAGALLLLLSSKPLRDAAARR